MNLLTMECSAVDELALVLEPDDLGLVELACVEIDVPEG
jgi:hypothetical protein